MIKFLKEEKISRETAQNIFHLLEYSELNDEGEIFPLSEDYYLNKEMILQKNKIKFREIEELLKLNKRSKYTQLTKTVKNNINDAGIHYDITSKFVYVRFDSFDTNVITEIIEIIKKGSRQGVKKLVIDLKNNYGGNVDNCAKLLDLFIERDFLFELHYSNKLVKYLSSCRKKVCYEQIEILTSNFTMSSAEIFIDVMSNVLNAFIPSNDRFNKKTGQSIYFFKRENLVFKVNSFYWKV